MQQASVFQFEITPVVHKDHEGKDEAKTYD